MIGAVARRAPASRLVIGLALALSITWLGIAQPARAAAPPRLAVRAAILVVPGTGQQLYGRDANRPLAIASATKLMTALLTLERAPLGRLFTEPVYYPAPADSQIGLVPGERMSVHDLLLALLLPSADDAAEDLAYNVGHGSVGRFIAMMNRRARALRLTHTHYSTPIGLDTPGNYSSASDLVKLAGYLLRKQRFFARAVALPGAVLRTGRHVRVVRNRNDLVGRIPWVNGVKTGHTLQAGYVLVGSARRRRMSLLSAVLGTSSESARDQTTLALLNYGFSSFRLVTPVRSGEVLARPAVKGSSGKRAAVIAATGLTRVIPRSARVRIRLKLPAELEGPLARHAVVGSAAVFAGGRRIARIQLLLDRPLPAVSSLSGAARFVTRPSTLVSLLVLIGAAIALAARRRERARETRKERAEPA